ncbi:uncharacterized protein LOC124814113 [Hydra vulgaris]|uniref:uncharacterized protein LOC124814113 n=1 Tax=Hydra vulgaris TaxID=6087 RepID=UPI001F5E95DA|nr:uncharacterized protein LOC124814113 [Hydra vulgaris]
MRFLFMLAPLFASFLFCDSIPVKKDDCDIRVMNGKCTTNKLAKEDVAISSDNDLPTIDQITNVFKAKLDFIKFMGEKSPYQLTFLQLFLDNVDDIKKSFQSFLKYDPVYPS